jgi:hypothetical protein
MRDILVFQISNWSSGFIWFATFLRVEDAVVVGKIASAELMFGFIGVYMTQLSLRLHGNGVTRTVERRGIYIRSGIIAISGLAAIMNTIEWTQLLAILAFSLTPAHLPLIMGYRRVLLLPLIARIPIAVFLIAQGGMNSSPAVVALVYFLPNIIYGLISYTVHYKLITYPIVISAKSGSNGRAVFQSILQLVVTIFCNIFQAKIVESLVNQSSSIAIFERLLRSGYSFVFPYLVRKSLVNAAVHLKLGLIFLLTVLISSSLFVSFDNRFKIIFPVMGDVYMSLVAGHVMRLDLVVALIFSMMLVKI